MRYIVILLILLARQNSMRSQTELVHSKTLWSQNDTFSVRFSNSSTAPWAFQISKRDTTDMGTDGTVGLKAILYFGKDSLVIAYKNLPGWQVHFIPVESPKGKTIYRLHFNGVPAAFSLQYIRENKGQIHVAIPEVYELANIIWTLSPSGQRAKDLNKQGDYYEKVTTYFKPYMDHPVFKKLDFPDSVYAKNYYDFRENSFCYQFNGMKLVNKGPYYYVMGNDWEDYTSLFKTLLPLVEDFAKKSNYRDFYKTHKAFYDSLIQKESRFMPVREMWKWLEQEFPKIKFNSYKIIFSPLIRGSHSTQNYVTYQQELYRETVMFVAGPGIYDGQELQEKQKEGLLSGIVFTEIDHNYVNPSSPQYRKLIDSIFSHRDAWVSPGDNSGFYNSPMSVFNEYMTHALFCLYVMDKYDAATADYIIKARETLMVERRHYSKFREFNRQLIKIRNENKDVNAVELFPKILEWCKDQLRSETNKS